MDFESLERTAVRAAYRSGEVLRTRYGKLSSIDKKGPTDLVTDADFASETEIVATIRAAGVASAALAVHAVTKGAAAARIVRAIPAAMTLVVRASVRTMVEDQRGALSSAPTR